MCRFERCGLWRHIRHPNTLPALPPLPSPSPSPHPLTPSSFHPLILILSPSGALIAEINDVLADGADAEGIEDKLSPKARETFAYMPPMIREQMLADRDPHGNVQVSKIETEKLLHHTTMAELAKLKAAGKYGGKFKTMFHFYGYEGRSGLPSLFDSNYCYALGYNAGALMSLGCTGFMSSIR